MRALLIALTSLLLGGCALLEDSKRNTLMDRVDQSVQLPRGLGPLDRYKRYYAYEPNGNVLALFVRRPTFDAQAKKREWIEGVEGLQLIQDGGCTVINVEFDGGTNKSNIRCNGIL